MEMLLRQVLPESLARFLPRDSPYPSPYPQLPDIGCQPSRNPRLSARRGGETAVG